MTFRECLEALASAACIAAAWRDDDREAWAQFILALERAKAAAPDAEQLALRPR